MRYNLQGQAIWASETERGYQTWDEYLIVNCSLLLFLPLIHHFLILREPLSSIGLASPDRQAVKLAWILLSTVLPILLIASRLPIFQDYYPIQKQAALSLRYLIYFEFTYGFYLFCWEFFFRGYLTFAAARAIGPRLAIVLQAAAFGAMHYTKPWPEFVGSFAAGIALGMLAWRAKSMVPCFALHWTVAVVFDLLVIYATPGGLF